MKFNYDNVPMKDKMDKQTKKTLIIGGICCICVVALGLGLGVYNTMFNIPVEQPLQTETQEPAPENTTAQFPTITQPTVTQPTPTVNDDLAKQETLETGDLNGDGAIGIMPEGFTPAPDTTPTQTAPTTPQQPNPSTGGLQGLFDGVPHEEGGGSIPYDGPINGLNPGEGEQVGIM